MVRGRKEFSRRQQVMSEVKSQEGLRVNGMETEGFSKVECDPALTKAFVERCQQRLSETKTFKQRGAKAFFSQLLVQEDYELDSPIMRFALEPRLLTTVANYLGIAPYLQSVELLYSMPVGGPPKASQMWHRDRQDTKVVKVFVYCLDVGPLNGPFTFLPKSSGDKVPGWHFHYIPDDKMQKYVPNSAVQELLGPAGSTLMIDTFACYHKGSNCVEPRLAAILYYDTGFGFRERMGKGRWDIPKEKMASLTKLQKLALGHVEDSSGNGKS
jgi:hypothetical protein